MEGKENSLFVIWKIIRKLSKITVLPIFLDVSYVILLSYVSISNDEQRVDRNLLGHDRECLFIKLMHSHLGWMERGLAYRTERCWLDSLSMLTSQHGGGVPVFVACCIFGARQSPWKMRFAKKDYIVSRRAFDIMRVEAIESVALSRAWYPSVLRSERQFTLRVKHGRIHCAVHYGDAIFVVNKRNSRVMRVVFSLE